MLLEVKASPLANLFHELPLGDGWELRESLHEIVSIGSQQLTLVGFCARNTSGTQVTGSAAELTSLQSASLFDRAYVELIERMAIVDGIEGSASALVFNATGRATRILPHQEVWPKANSKSFEPAKSNGVAVGRGWQEAIERARAELLERDLVLASWLGETRPRRIEELPIAAFHQMETHRWEAYCVGSRYEHESYVCIGWPLQSEAPLTLGFGCHKSPAMALRKACEEALQRLGFLWGEKIPKELPELGTSADFHQEYFLSPASHDLLQAWLAGEFYVESVAAAGLSSQVRFVDLTPVHLRGRLNIVKAIDPSCYVLNFGLDPQMQRHPKGAVIHPVC